MDFESNMNTAVGHHRSGRFAEAAAGYRAVLAAFPEQPDALHLLGLTTHRLGDTAAALALVERALVARSTDTGFLASRANLLLTLQRWADAAAAFRLVLAATPQDPHARNGLAVALQQLGDTEEAESLLRALLAELPEFVPALDNLAAMLLKRGRADLGGEAETLARRSIALQPKSAEAHNNLGSALVQLRRNEEAVPALQSALRLRTGYLEATYNLALARIGANDLPGADAAIRTALKLAPDSVANLITASSVSRELSLGDEALVLAQRAYDLDAEAPEVLVTLSQAWRDQNEFEKSEQYLHTAAVKSNSAQHWTMLAHLHWEMGKLADAEQDVANALVIDPNRIAARAVLAQSGRCQSLEDKNLQALLGAVERPSLSDEDRMAILFAIGKSLDDLGEYQRSFTYYQRANALKKALNRHYQGDTEHIFELECRKTFTPDNVARMSKHGSSSEVPVFVVGLPRSGTSLAEQIIASHPDIYGAGELIKMREISSRVGAMSATRGGPEYPPGLLTLQPEEILRLARMYLDHVYARAGEPKLRIVDKMPLNLRHLGLIAVLFPRAKVVHCVRNPVDNCLSMYFQNFGRGNLFANDLDDVGLFYSKCRDMMAMWRETLPIEILDLPYEGVVADQEGWARKLIAHIGLPWNDACLSFHKTDRAVRTASAWQVKQPIYKRSVARWKRYGDAIEPLLSRLRQEGVPFDES